MLLAQLNVPTGLEEARSTGMKPTKFAVMITLVPMKMVPQALVMVSQTRECVVLE